MFGELAENLRPSRATSASRAASASASVRVRSVSCITTRNARLFRSCGHARAAVNAEQRRPRARWAVFRPRWRPEPPGPGSPARKPARCRAPPAGSREGTRGRGQRAAACSGSASSSNSTGGLRQLVLALPLRMQLADPARRRCRRAARAPSARDGTPDARPASKRSASGAHSASRSRLHVEEVHRARRRRPTARRAPGRTPPRRCASAGARRATDERAVRRRRVAQEHAADLEDADARRPCARGCTCTFATSEPISERAHHRLLAGDRVEQADRVRLAGEIGFPGRLDEAEVDHLAVVARGQALAQRVQRAPAAPAPAACAPATRGGCAAMRSKP